MSYYLIITLSCTTLIGLVGLGIIYLPVKYYVFNLFKWCIKSQNMFPKTTTHVRQEPTLYKQAKYSETSQSGPIPSSKSNKLDRPIFCILYLMAPPNHPYMGDLLWETLINQGLKYGPMKIFHVYPENKIDENSLFSVANALEPGYFDINHIDRISTPGLCLFMNYSSLANPLKTFESMLILGKRLECLLGGTLSDYQRRPLSENLIQTYKAKLATFDSLRESHV